MNECNHKWKVVEDYNTITGWFLKRVERIKIFECKICGEQKQRWFAPVSNEVIENDN